MSCLVWVRLLIAAVHSVCDCELVDAVDDERPEHAVANSMGLLLSLFKLLRVGQAAGCCR
jgi:hypothetical protein